MRRRFRKAPERGVIGFSGCLRAAGKPGEDDASHLSETASRYLLAGVANQPGPWL